MPVPRSSRHVQLVAAVAIAMLACTAYAESSSPRGQWIGNTQVDGERSTDKTTLQLGASDAESTTLLIDTGRACKLRDGSYSAQGEDAWVLRFKPNSGDSVCERLSQGEFTLRNAGPRKLSVEVRYPDGKGGQLQRSGVLARYP